MMNFLSKWKSDRDKEKQQEKQDKLERERREMERVKEELEREAQWQAHYQSVPVENGPMVYIEQPVYDVNTVYDGTTFNAAHRPSIAGQRGKS